MAKKKNKKSSGPPKPMIRLSQCMIVKNEEKNIERALGWAKSIAFEQIVVDTGSTDRTVEIAEKMGAKVYHFNWICDFSAAKNFAIEQATGNWIAFLDADEYFSPIDAKKLMIFLKRIHSDPQMRDRYLALNCAWVNVDENGKPFSVLDQERVFRNLPSIRYINKIHERLDMSIDNVVQVDEISIIHTGYSGAALEETGKWERNVEMLRAELAGKPGDLNIKAYLADSLKLTSDPVGIAEADALFMDVIEGGADVIPELKKKAYLHILTRNLDAHSKRGDCEELCRSALRDLPGDIDFDYYYAYLLNIKGEFPKALELLKGCEERLAVAAPGDSLIVAVNPGLLAEQLNIATAQTTPGTSNPGVHTSSNTAPPRTQFEEEAQTLKTLMYDMINSGQAEAAGQLIHQYTLLNPSDPEIRKIRALIHPEGSPSQELDIPEEYALLKEVETCFIISGIITKKTGFFNSIFSKIKLMEEKWGYRPLVITTLPNLDQKQTQVWLQTLCDDQKVMSSGIKMLNVYEHFQKTNQERLVNKAIYSIADDGKRYVKTSDNSYDVFEGDILIRQEFYTGYSGSLRMIRHYKNGRKENDFGYDDQGYLSFIRKYNLDNDEDYCVEYYTTDGNLCIEAFYNSGEDGSELEKLIVYNASGAVVKECADHAELAALCITEIISSDKFYIVVVEDGLMSKAAAILENGKNVARGIVVHNIFSNDAYNLSSEPQLYYEYLCKNPEKFEAVVFLTEGARDDFISKYGDIQNTFVIPHPYPHEIIRTDFDKRNHRKSVIIARLVPEKQINLAIDIFRIVVDKMPEMSLEIYGRGSEEDRLNEQIRKLGLENNVFLMGYTDDALGAFRSAALSMMTSWAEGFGLTISESICNGCPAFAFDIKYGPSDIIKDGETGFLFPRFDVDRFAGKMIEYLGDVDMQRIMSKNCYVDAPEFSTDRFLEKWFKMSEMLCDRR